MVQNIKEWRRYQNHRGFYNNIQTNGDLRNSNNLIRTSYDSILNKGNSDETNHIFRENSQIAKTKRRDFPDVLVRQATEENLLSYVRRKYTNLNNDPTKLEETKVRSKKIANNLYRMREKFSLVDSDDQCPIRKFVFVDPKLKFSFKRRSVDFTSANDLKKKVTQGKLFKIHEDYIFETGHQDFKLNTPISKELELFKVEDKDIKLPTDPNLKLVQSHHFLKSLTQKLITSIKL